MPSKYENLKHHVILIFITTEKKPTQHVLYDDKLPKVTNSLERFSFYC